MPKSERPYGVVMGNRMAELQVGVNELARAAGVSKETIARIRDGKTPNPGPATRRKIEAALAMPPEVMASTDAVVAGQLAALAAHLEAVEALIDERFALVLDDLAALRRELSVERQRAFVAEAVFDLAP